MNTAPRHTIDTKAIPAFRSYLEASAACRPLEVAEAAKALEDFGIVVEIKSAPDSIPETVGAFTAYVAGINSGRWSDAAVPMRTLKELGVAVLWQAGKGLACRQAAQEARSERRSAS